MLGGQLVEMFFSREAIHASEMFWWSEGRGKELLEAFEQWAREAGATGIIMADLNDPERNAVMESLYGKRGYALTERHFVKAI